MVVKNTYMNSRVSHKKSHQVQLNVSTIRQASKQTFLYWAQGRARPVILTGDTRKIFVSRPSTSLTRRAS